MGFFEFERLFLSHAAADEELAAIIETQVRQVDHSREVFRASNVSHIPAGDLWFKKIVSELSSADHLFVLLTEESVDRPWMWFEAGAAVGRGIPIVVAIAGDLSLQDVPQPLASLQLLRLDDPDSAAALFKKIGIRLPNVSSFCKVVRRIAGEVRPSSDAIRIGDAVYAWRGKVEHLKDATPIPTPLGLEDALQRAGLEARYGIQQDLANEHSQGYAQVYLIDGKARRALLRSGQVLLARQKA